MWNKVVFYFVDNQKFEFHQNVVIFKRIVLLIICLRHFIFMFLNANLYFFIRICVKSFRVWALYFWFPCQQSYTNRLRNVKYIRSYDVSLRSRRLEVMGTRKNGRARRRHPLACLPRAHPFSLSPAISKGLLRRLLWCAIVLFWSINENKIKAKKV